MPWRIERGYVLLNVCILPPFLWRRRHAPVFRFIVAFPATKKILRSFVLCLHWLRTFPSGWPWQVSSSRLQTARTAADEDNLRRVPATSATDFPCVSSETVFPATLRRNAVTLVWTYHKRYQEGNAHLTSCWSCLAVSLWIVTSESECGLCLSTQSIPNCVNRSYALLHTTVQYWTSCKSCYCSELHALFLFARLYDFSAAATIN